MKFTPTIGLEIHAELLTKTKMFCDCLNDETELTPNKNICPVCAGHPGTLPVPNKQAVDFVIKTGLALNCMINHRSKFDRKNYFYPDLPKAYQISQYDQPLCKDGFLVLPESGKKIRITRIHLEEDTARIVHEGPSINSGQSASLIDFNRAGVPLMELVTEPDFHSAEDVVAFAKEFQKVLRYVSVSDGDMEKGHLRLEANISIAPEGSQTLGTKVEVKNLNSFRAVGGAVEYEIKRHTQLWNEGRQNEIIQETRGWNDAKGETYTQRSKEEAHDYRYFPEPDIPPMEFLDADIKAITETIVELPSARRERLSSEYNLSAQQVALLVQDSVLCSFYEEAVSEARADVPDISPELIFSYLSSDVKGIESDVGIILAESKLTPAFLADIAVLVHGNTISSRVAKDMLKRVYQSGENPNNIVKQEGLVQVSDESALMAIIQNIITSHADVVAQYKAGKQNALQFLIGKAMAQTKGAANPSVLRELFEKELMR